MAQRPSSSATHGDTEADERARVVRPARRRGRALGRWLARVALALLFVVGAVTSLVPGGRAAARGAILLGPVLTATQPAPFVAMSEGVRHTSLTIASASGPVYLDVYAPTTPVPVVPGARGGLLMIPGVGDERQVPQLINLADSLARSGEVVMLMTTPILIAYGLSPTDSDAVVQAFDRLARWPGVGAGRVGIIGLSAGGPLACLAATDPRVRDRIAFIVSFGGYYDVTDVLRDVGRRALLIDGHLQPWTPSPVALNVLANVLAHRLPEPDASDLQAAFSFSSPTPIDPATLASFSLVGQAAYHLLAGDQPANVEANVAMLLGVAGDLLRALSPSAIVGRIRAPIYLLHDRNDPSLPVTEARDFAAELARLHHPYDYVEVNILAHTEVVTSLPTWDLLVGGVGLSRLMYHVLLVGS